MYRFLAMHMNRLGIPDPANTIVINETCQCAFSISSNLLHSRRHNGFHWHAVGRKFNFEKLNFL